MKDIFLIFPIHLFKNTDLLNDKKVYIIEEPRYFTDFKYNKLKLVYHRASMKNYLDYLKEKNIECEYIDLNDVKDIFYKKFKGKTVLCYDMNDFVLEKKIRKLIPNINIKNSLNFTLNPQLIEDNKSKFMDKNGGYRQDLFYKWQRVRLDILVTKSGEPKGGRWSFDKDNRKPLPKSVNLPEIPNKIDNEYYNEAKEYINSKFGDNYGETENTIYPIDHTSAKRWLKWFLDDKFANFGKYEDAETDRNPFIFHSILTPMMNIGLLTDSEVIEETLKYENRTPIESFEGFIRQVIGWRNYVYSVYVLDGEKMKKMNFMNNKNKLNFKKWWTGIGIEPIDYIIDKMKKYAYAHHIERLMYLGNFMYLLEIKPMDVYKIFMEWTIDGYEWVMIPNVMGMSQYADGGKMMTRPYFSSSNYILKMSDWKRGEWCQKWDILYYNYIRRNRAMLKKNYATAQQVVHWDRKSENEKKQIQRDAKKLINELK